MTLTDININMTLIAIIVHLVLLFSSLLLLLLFVHLSSSLIQALLDQLPSATS